MSLDYLRDALNRRARAGVLRSLQLAEGLIDLTSNDYFGFAKSLVSNSVKTCGATGSRLLSGHHSLYDQIENRLADFHKAESALVFNSGYCANLGLISALGIENTTFIYDLDIHASMLDGLQLARAQKLPFRHNDLNSLERTLKKAHGTLFVLVESHYSMSGDRAPLQDITSLCEKYGASLIVDEAHATGLFGEQGEGYVVAESLEKRVFARIHTFSKALGVHGACVVGSQILKDYLINFSRPFIYTTALSPSALSLIAMAYDKLESEGQYHRKRLSELIAFLQRKLGISEGLSPIVSILTGEGKARALSDRCRALGLDVRAILPPTVKREKESLRLVLHSFNDETQIDRFLEAL